MGQDNIFVVKKGKKKKVSFGSDITMVILCSCGFWQEVWGSNWKCCTHLLYSYLRTSMLYSEAA